MTGRNPWAVLGLAEDASYEDIQRAYRGKVKQTHPDRGGAASDFGRSPTPSKISGVSIHNGLQQRSLRSTIAGFGPTARRGHRQTMAARHTEGRAGGSSLGKCPPVNP